MWLKDPKNIDQSIIEKTHISPPVGAYALFYQFIDGNIEIINKSRKYLKYLQNPMTKLV